MAAPPSERLVFDDILSLTVYNEYSDIDAALNISSGEGLVVFRNAQQLYTTVAQGCVAI